MAEPARLETTVDPITLEIIRGSLGSAIRDMELLMERCAMSPFTHMAMGRGPIVPQRTSRSLAR